MLLAMFGFMDLLIIAKWTTDFSGREDQAPSLISTMIAMFLSGGAIPEGNAPILGSVQYQQKVSVALAMVVVICIPLMLFPKPIILSQALSKRQERI
jgi:V-type H+-transporting ATPase subunit a